MKKGESEERRNPEAHEIEWRMGEEIRKLKLALDGRINELKKFKNGYSNSKREHERVKKSLNKEIEELQVKILQGKKEYYNEELEKLRHQNNELSKWHDYVKNDLDNIILRMEKIEDRN